MNVNRQSMKVPLPSRGLKTTMPGLFMDKRYSPGMDNVRMYAGEVLNRPGSSYLPSGGQTLDNIPLGGGLLQTTADALYTVLATKTK